MISLLSSISCTPHEQKLHQLRSRTMQPEYPQIPFMCGWPQSLVPCSSVLHSFFTPPMPPASQGWKGCQCHWHRVFLVMVPLASREGVVRTCETDDRWFFSLTALLPCGWHVEEALAF